MLITVATPFGLHIFNISEKSDLPFNIRVVVVVIKKSFGMLSSLVENN